jgi:hypothetical protein
MHASRLFVILPAWAAQQILLLLKVDRLCAVATLGRLRLTRTGMCIVA